jgi:hypothetical protein
MPDMGTERRAAARPPGLSELRLLVGGVELRVTGVSREDCFRQLEAAAQEVDQEELEAEARYRLTEAGRRALAGAA